MVWYGPGHHPGNFKLFKIAGVIRDCPGPSGTIFQSGVVRNGSCSYRVNSGMVRSGTVLILGELGWSGVVRVRSGAVRIGTELILVDPGWCPRPCRIIQTTRTQHGSTTDEHRANFQEANSTLHSYHQAQNIALFEKLSNRPCCHYKLPE